MSNSDELHEEDVFDVDRIRRLVELMKEHELNEIDLRQSRQRIRLCRGEKQVTPSVVYTQAPVASALAPAAPQAAAPAAPAVSKPAEDGAHITLIKSPMVGTFYNRPNPNSEPFVKVGSSISPETTVCIIEAMKVFNEIPAETRGKIVEILVANDEAVDFGKPLFKVDTRG